MLHGHQHNHREYNINNRKNGILRYDVGVDANGMSPVSAAEEWVFSIRFTACPFLFLLPEFHTMKNKIELLVELWYDLSENTKMVGG